MLIIDSTGVVIDPRVRHAISPALERGDMKIVHGIIVHQTNAPTSASTLNSYQQPKPNGAHFLIDRDGTIYQTASLYKKTAHIGQLKSRCIAQHTCTPTELKALKGKKPGKPIGRIEAKKDWPNRYPSNGESIGIEIVGQALPKTVPEDQQVFERLTKAQQASLQWLIQELTLTLNIQLSEIFRHPTVSWKNETEASTATW